MTDDIDTDRVVESAPVTHLATCSGCLLPKAAVVTCWDRGVLYSYCGGCYFPPKRAVLIPRRKKRS